MNEPFFRRQASGNLGKRPYSGSVFFFPGSLIPESWLCCNAHNLVQYKEKTVIDSLEKPQYVNFHTKTMGGVHRPLRIIDSAFLIITFSYPHFAKR